MYITLAKPRVPATADITGQLLSGAGKYNIIRT